MQDEILRQFNGDIHTKEALIEFIQDCLNREALERVYKGEDVSHIADAWKAIHRSFEELNTIYGIKEKSKQSEIAHSK